MDAREWLNQLAEAVCGRIREVEVRNVDPETMTLAHRNVVCTVHVLNNRTASFVASRSGAGVGAAAVEFDDPRVEVMDELSLTTVPAVIADWLRNSDT